MSQPRHSEHESTEIFCCEANMRIDRLTVQNFKKFAGQTFQPAPARRSEGKRCSPALGRPFYDCCNERIRFDELRKWFHRETTAAGNRSGRMRIGFAAKCGVGR